MYYVEIYNSLPVYLGKTNIALSKYPGYARYLCIGVPSNFTESATLKKLAGSPQEVTKNFRAESQK